MDTRKSSVVLGCLTGAILAVGGCSNDPNHLGHPLSWPGAAMGTAVGNVLYDARRSQIKRLLIHSAADLRRGEDSAFDALFSQAAIRPHRQAKVKAEIMALPTGPDWAEQATIIVMVHAP